MSDRAVFLHVTDAHVSARGVPHLRDDAKVTIPGVPAGTREHVLTQLFNRLEERLERTGDRLDGVIFSGDAQSRGDPGGHELVYRLIIDRLERFGVTPNRIVATPGNHDVPRDSAPSSAARYEAFIKVWSDAGCVVPWLDGIDSLQRVASDRHRLVAADFEWALFAVNTSNWSNVKSILPKPLGDVWDAIPEAVAPADKALADEIRKQLQALARYDMARLSEQQLEVLRNVIRETPRPKHGRQLRIAVMHHHLRSPSLREELKPFEGISNLEQVRTLFRGGGVDVVVHGHKHEHAVYYDHIYSDAGEDPHRVLVISGATFDVGREQDAMRLITLTGLPHVPTVTIERLPLARAGADWRPEAPVVRDLWAQNARRGDPVTVIPGAPITVEGSDIDQVYARACGAASSLAARGTLIVHLDLPDADGTALPLPSGYPMPAAAEGDVRDEWIRDLVACWQLKRSHLEHRIPFVHGSRLRRYGGKIDQIRRIISLLRAKESTRAIAVLVDPFCDFNPDGKNEKFASFCLVEFRRRNTGTVTVVDAIAFYRAQEFARWWPVNVAELRLLQAEIASELGFKCGRITTVAADARTIAKSPTQVAMPIIDRWLDQAPERLHLLADAFVHRSVQSDGQRRAVAEWRQALAELRSATMEFNPDGVPIAIEGPRMLAAYVSATAEPGDADAAVLAIRLQALADHNEGYENTKRELGNFRTWAPAARHFVEELERLTTLRLGSPPTSVESTG